MKSKLPKKKAASRFDEPFEIVEIEYIATSENDADQVTCAVVRTLLEIDQILSKEETDLVYKEAS
ncbi:MAG: hypothetical protein KF789_01575 [Bdellovibrionaceae bacterium]|nr:hypothetical protein [Pseudobdellovibrionaceae bacterium]